MKVEKTSNWNVNKILSYNYKAEKLSQRPCKGISKFSELFIVMVKTCRCPCMASETAFSALHL